jgi:hypothetical protein
VETTVEGPGNLRFRWKTAGAADVDLLSFAVDGSPLHSRSGADDWEERLVEIGAGTQILRWTHARGSETGEARAWLDAVSYEAASAPSVTTAAPADATEAGATLGGEVVDDGGREVTARGVVYGTAPDPVLEGGADLPAATAGTGSFAVSADGLDEGTTYYARAYATNNLGTAYGAGVAFTTDTDVVFVDGLAFLSRAILPGDAQVFRFTQSGPRIFGYSTRGVAGLEARLFDQDATLLQTYAEGGEIDGSIVLEAGSYFLEVRRPDGDASGTQDFVLTLDERTEAVTRPDAMVGRSLGAMTGSGVYSGLAAQQLRLVSRRGRPVSGHVSAANRGNRPDRIALRGRGGSRFFRVNYYSATGLVTGGVLSGLYLTTELGPGDPAESLRVAVVPNKRLLRGRKGRRNLFRRKTHTVAVYATSELDPAVGDGVSVRVKTR